MRKLLFAVLGLLLAAGGTLALIELFSFAGEHVSDQQLVVDAEDLAEVQELRTRPIDPAHPLRLQVEVDYTQDEAGAWWPKQQSPVLDDLTNSAGAPVVLPPVAERTGSEPCVYRGVDGVTNYGGQLFLGGDGSAIINRWSACTLVRWSPQGYPLVPHVARSFAASDDARTFTFVLRKGMRWSDGEPFTSDDIRYWYEHELQDQDAMLEKANPMFLPKGRPVRMEFDDDTLTFRFIFDEPQGLFLEMLARAPGMECLATPAHFLRRYHPHLGTATEEGKAFLEAEMTARSCSKAEQLYKQIKAWDNPEHPRLWPWIYKVYVPDPPVQFVRNPYYWVVDEAGRQLPYTDAIFCQNYDRDMTPKVAAEGAFSFSDFKVRYHEMLMAGRKQFGYHVYRWFRADRSDAMLYVNLNKRWQHFDPKDDIVALPLDQTKGFWLAETITDNAGSVRLTPRDETGAMVRIGDRELAILKASLPAGQDGSLPAVKVVKDLREDPLDQEKARLLRDRRFRKALSLAIDRPRIIKGVYYDETVPAQCAPGPESPWYHQRLRHEAVTLDRQRAEQILDDLGLKRPSPGAFRCLPDGRRLWFVVAYPDWFLPATAQFVCEDWQAVGIQAFPRQRNSKLFYSEKKNLTQDFTCFTGNNEFMPVLDPRCFVPTGHEANWAIGYAAWYTAGGLYGDPKARQLDCIRPDPADEVGAAVLETMRLYDRIKATPRFTEQKAAMDRILDIAADNLWTISLCTSPDYVVVVNNHLRNVPVRGMFTFDFIAPGNMGMETWSFDPPTDAQVAAQPDLVAQNLNREAYAVVRRVLADPPRASAASVTGKQQADTFGAVAAIIGWIILAVVIGFVLLVAVRHPFVARRILIMIPTLLVISVVTFTIIQLPEGDYLDQKIMEMAQQGDKATDEQVEALRRDYHLDQPAVTRYFLWMGFKWFVTYDAKDQGLLQGFLGRSMIKEKPVNDIIGDRFILTLAISLLTILLTWLIAIPTGIYSAVRQYSVGDYVFTFIGFVGMCIPSFLFAIILMYVSQRFFNTPISGLFSPEYATQTTWTWGKVIDLAQHIWLPVVVLALTGTAGMIRVMRGNLLDELKKPYVTTARAKGVRPLKLLMKYPVRLALNPFVSTLGGIFPQLVAGGAIIAMVLSLPTIGPLMLEGVLNEDLYLACSLLMVLSLLGVLGTLVSDLVLLWLDPRIRMEGGSRR